MIALYDAALDASTLQFAFCPGCRKKVQVEKPDWQARLRALEWFAENGWGRPPAARDDGAALGELVSRPAEELSAVERRKLLAAVREKLSEEVSGGEVVE